MDSEKINLKLETELQSNGIYATPLNCISISEIPNKCKNMLLFSAILQGVSQHYGEKFSVINLTDDAVIIMLNDSGLRKLEFKNFKLDGNILSLSDEAIQKIEKTKLLKIQIFNFIKENDDKKVIETSDLMKHFTINNSGMDILNCISLLVKEKQIVKVDKFIRLNYEN